MKAALIVSICCCIYFIYRWVTTEIKCTKELANFASALLTANCVLDKLLEEKMDSEAYPILSFDISEVRNPEEFAARFASKYDITMEEDKIKFHHCFK